MGDVYNSANNDMPITIAKRYGITISSFLQQNLEQQPMLRGKSKLKANTKLILYPRHVGGTIVCGSTLVQTPRLNARDLTIKPKHYVGTPYELIYQSFADQTTDNSSHTEYEKRGNLLYHHHPGSGKWCVVLPKEKQQQAVMDEIHHYAEGHLGRDRMSNLLTSKYYWQGQSRDIQSARRFSSLKSKASDRDAK